MLCLKDAGYEKWPALWREEKLLLLTGDVCFVVYLEGSSFLQLIHLRSRDMQLRVHA